MKTFAAVAFAALIATTSALALSSPAAAGNKNGKNGNNNNHHHHQNHRFKHHGGVVFGFSPVIVSPVLGGWNAHVAWCHKQFFIYNPKTNVFKTKGGKHGHCDSPFF